MDVVTAEMRQAAVAFAAKWGGQIGEKQLAQSFWTDFFTRIVGVPDLLAAGIDFERPVRPEKGTTGFIDVLWGGVVLIEHKSGGKSLDVAEVQARGYLKALPAALRTPFIIVSNFHHIRIVDVALGTSVEFPLSELPNNLDRLVAVFGSYTARATKHEVAADRRAGEKMAKLYTALEDEGYGGHEASVFLVRLLFLLFGDDTGMWKKPKAFEDLVLGEPADGSTLGPVISGLFSHLDDEHPPKTIPAAYKPFPWVNGGLFVEPIRIFHFTQAMRDALVDACSYDWSSISPAIFGAMFQTVKSKKERRELGEHYTSEANILKLIRPLFLDDFTERMLKAWDSPSQLKKLRAEIGSKRFLDPACGAGNFLLVAYKRLRELDLKMLVRLEELTGKSAAGAVGLDGIADVGVAVSIDQFHGFEIEEWSSQIATVAMFLADRQANLAMEEIVGTSPNRFPLTESAHIHHVNALTTDWASLVTMDDDTFIFGNPPFYGARNLSKEQQGYQAQVWFGVKGFSDLDFVASWVLLAGRHLRTTKGRAAFVATNSITQGQQPAILWGQLYPLGVGIDFAHRSFLWSNAGGAEASVYVVILGLSSNPKPAKRPLWSYETARGDAVLVNVPRINAYLLDAPDILIGTRSKHLQTDTPAMVNGSMPLDKGWLSDLPAETVASIRATDPVAEKYLRRVVGAQELINGDERWGVWLKDAPPEDIHGSSILKELAKNVRDYRLASDRAATVKYAQRPTEWAEQRHPSGPYIAVPRHSSENREYIPMGYLKAGEVAIDALLLVPSASMVAFGVLSSKVFVAWTKAVSGRLKSDPRISSTVTYNNFPFPHGDGWKAIEEAAKKVLTVRDGYDASLAALYDPLTMPTALRKAHADLDKAVLAAYGLKSNTSEVGILEELFTRYSDITAGLLAEAKSKGKKVSKKA